jgi:hypothetical protein
MTITSAFTFTLKSSSCDEQHLFFAQKKTIAKLIVVFCTFYSLKLWHLHLFLWRNILNRRSQWPRNLRRRSAAARLLELWVRIPPEARISVCCECCVLSGRGLCVELITRPEETYRLWCVVVCEIETS